MQASKPRARLDLVAQQRRDPRVDGRRGGRDGAWTAESPRRSTEPPVNPVTPRGDIWAIGRHRLICGDAATSVVRRARRAWPSTWPSPRRRTPRSASTIRRAASSRSRRTSTWIGSGPVAGNVQACWPPTVRGSQHQSPRGERRTPPLHAGLGHRAQAGVGWRYVDEFCWRKTDNGVPGGWPNRSRTLGEPVHHYAARPKSNSTRWLVHRVGLLLRLLAAQS